MFEQTQFDLLRGWALAATELPEVIMAHQSAPRPETEYGLLNLIRSSKIHRPIEYQLEVNPDHAADPTGEPPFFEISVQEFEFVWSFQVYSQNPITVGNRLNPWKTTQPGRELLGPLNMFKIGDFQRVPEMVEQNWNDRAVSELQVRTYVCSGTSTYGQNEVLLGRVPVDVAESVSVLFPGTVPALNVTADKP